MFNQTNLEEENKKKRGKKGKDKREGEEKRIRKKEKEKTTGHLCSRSLLRGRQAQRADGMPLRRAGASGASGARRGEGLGRQLALDHSCGGESMSRFPSRLGRKKNRRNGLFATETVQLAGEKRQNWFIYH